MKSTDKLKEFMEKGYGISTKKRLGAASTWGSSINAYNLEDLKQKLQELKINHFSLSYNTFFDDDLHDHKRWLTTEELSEDDFAWLIEKTNYDSRFIMY